jgi:hypothetical protein
MTAKIKSRLSIAIVVTALTRGASPQDVLVNRQINGIRNSVLIESEPTTIQGLERFYALDSGRPYIASVTDIFRTKFDASQVLNGRGATDLDTSVWYKQYADYSRRRPEGMGEIIEIGKDAVLRTIKSGKFEQKVVSGRNPLVCGTEENGCEVIWISIGIIPPHQEKTFSRPKISLFVRTKHLPSLTESQRLAEALRHRFDTQLLTVSFRTDEWFLLDSEFPVVYPFRTDPKIIRPSDIDVRNEVICVSVGAPFRCSKVI